MAAQFESSPQIPIPIAKGLAHASAATPIAENDRMRRLA